MRIEDVNSIESEAGIIATLIHHPEFIFHSEQLLPNHFTDRDNSCIYTAIYKLMQNDIQVVDAYNIITVLSSDEATRRYSATLAVDKLNDLIDMSSELARGSVEEYKLLVDKVLDMAFRRDTIRRLRDCEALCFDMDEPNIEHQIYDLIDDVMVEFSSTDDVPEFKDVVDKLWEEVEAHQDGKESGMPFKFPTLNEYVSIEPGELVVLGAPAKGAKSMFMMNTAVDLLRQGKSVMYIDSELSSRLFLCRVLSHLTGIEFKRIRSGRYTEDESKLIQEQIKWIKKQKLVHMYLPLFDSQTIYTTVKRVAHRFDKLDVLIVDYLKATGDADAYATYAELGKLTDMVKNDIAGAMGIAGIAAAQLNANGKLADSAKISRNASSILLLIDKTPEEIDEYGLECGNKKLIVSLNRNGMQHVSGEWIDVAFNGNQCTLTEAKQHIPNDPY